MQSRRRSWQAVVSDVCGPLPPTELTHVAATCCATKPDTTAPLNLKETRIVDKLAKADLQSRGRQDSAGIDDELANELLRRYICGEAR